MGRIPVIVVLVAASLVFMGAVALAQEEDGSQYGTTAPQYAGDPSAATTSDEATGGITPPATTPEATTMAEQYLDRLGGRLPQTRRGELPSTGGPGPGGRR